MASRNFSSTARAAELAVAVTGTVTLLKVSSVSGLPPVPFTLVVDVATESEEIVEVTGVAGLNLTVVRGVDGSAAVPHQVGAVVRHMATARDFRDGVTHRDASAGAHGVGAASAVVGTETSQTLKNKTFSGADNTFTDLPTGAFAAGSVTTAKLADDAVTTAKLGADSVTDAKIAGVAPEKVAGTGTLTTERGRWTSTTPADASSTAHGFQVGPTGGANVAVGPGQVVGRNNGVLAKVGVPGGVTGLPLPTADTDAASRRYVDLRAPQPVTSEADRALKVAALPAAPTAATPFFVFRTNAVPGFELEVTTDGTTFVPVNRIMRDAAQPYLMQGASQVVAINGSGFATISFPSAFTTLVRTVQVNLGDTAAGVGSVNQTGFNPATLTGFNILALDRSGNPMTGGNVRVNWTALGY